MRCGQRLRKTLLRTELRSETGFFSAQKIVRKVVRFLKLTVTSVLNGIGQVSIEGLLVVQDMPQLEKS